MWASWRFDSFSNGKLLYVLEKKCLGSVGRGHGVILMGCGAVLMVLQMGIGY